MSAPNTTNQAHTQLDFESKWKWNQNNWRTFMCFSLYSLNACCLLSAQFVAILCEIILLYGRLTTKFFFRYVFVSFRNKAFCLRRQFFHSYMIKVVNECTIRNIERTSDNQFCLILKDTQFYLSVCFWFLYKGEKKNTFIRRKRDWGKANKCISFIQKASWLSNDRFDGCCCLFILIDCSHLMFCHSAKSA